LKKKKRWRICYLIYSLIIIKLIIFKYPISELLVISQSWGEGFIRDGIASANFIPFKTIMMYIKYYETMNSFENLIGNILVFIPLGFILPRAFYKFNHPVWLVFFSFVFIMDVELFQLVTRFGAFDVDDIILNMLGVILGFLITKMIEKLRVQIAYRKEGIYESL